MEGFNAISLKLKEMYQVWNLTSLRILPFVATNTWNCASPVLFMDILTPYGFCHLS